MKSKFDVSEFRNPVIEMHNLTGMDNNYTFYYDETNNIRKFYLRENGFNVSDTANFVLGGVMHDNDISNANIPLLIKKLKLQNTVKEIKLKYLARGNFIECLKSKKLQIFLEWLLESDLFIHYSNLNIFYFSIVDIIDSAVMNSKLKNNIYFSIINELKSELFKYITIDKANFLELLYSYEYPNIKKDKINDFINSILDFLELHEEKIENKVMLEVIKSLLNESVKANELCFIMDEIDSILIDDFVLFYLRPIYMFKNSIHIFDEESEIQNKMNGMQLYDSDELIESYSFKESHHNPLIQISDIITGLVGKYFSYLNEINLCDIENKKSILNNIQHNNLDLFKKLIIKSDNKNRALLHSTMSQEEYSKNIVFLGL